MSGGMAFFGQGVATLMIGRGLNGYYQFVGQFFDHQRKIGVNFLGIRFFFKNSKGKILASVCAIHKHISIRLVASMNRARCLTL